MMRHRIDIGEYGRDGLPVQGVSGGNECVRRYDHLATQLQRPDGFCEACNEGESEMMHDSTTVFTVNDVMESLTYYRDKIGFEVAFEYGKPIFYVGLFSGEVNNTG